MEDQTVLIVGGGAREHAISEAYEKSSRVRKIIVSPGNEFIGFDRRKEVIVDKSCDLEDKNSIFEIAKKYGSDIIDIAQDDALASGAVDLLEQRGFRVFGPEKEAARIEWDKIWSREFMKENDIPIPEFEVVYSENSARKYLEKLYEINPDKRIFIKVRGLCGGKGALKAENIEEAVDRIEEIKKFQNIGEGFLIEQGLVGEEFSYYVISDGNNYQTFKSAQDNKTVFNFDEGGQTGGMGAVSPSLVTEPISREIESELIKKVFSGMKKRGLKYKGILYLGGIVVDGKPMNIEYNARWGDPECQTVLPGLETDYLEVVDACLEGRLDEIELKQDNQTRVCVVGSSRGYPKDYSSVKGKEIFGLEKVREIEGVNILGAGIVVEDGKFYVNGGRLFSVVGEGNDILEAKQKVYAAMAHVNIEGNNLHYRTDIGWRDVERVCRVKN